MRKVILSMMTSVDGFIEGRGCDISWHVWDEEMSEYMMDFFQRVDTFLYGRKSYELMIDYWPSETGPFADIMNNTSKVVFSRTLKKVTWNARLVNENAAQEVRTMKEKHGKDIVLFAGSDLASTLINNGLIDEYRLIVNPVVLGAGNSLFKNMEHKLELNRTETKSFKCGNTLIRYQPHSNGK